MECSFKITVWCVILLTLIGGIITTATEDNFPPKRKSINFKIPIRTKNNFSQSNLHEYKPKVMKTSTEVSNTKHVWEEINESEEENAIPKTISYKFNNATRVTHYDPIKNTKNDQDLVGAQSWQDKEYPIKEVPDLVLSSSSDAELSNINFNDHPAHASFESIVYNPATKDATTAFSRNIFVATPELITKESSQRREGKNSLVTSSTKVQYTPNYASSQTPTADIKYRENTIDRQYQRPTPRAPVRKPKYEAVQKATVLRTTSAPYVEESENVENEDESRENLREDDEEKEVEEERPERPSYPVNLKESFDPYHAVEEPDDIYNQVLSNINSVYYTENEEPGFKSPITNKNNAPGDTESYEYNIPTQYEQYSYENLQKYHSDDRERSDDDERQRGRQNINENIADRKSDDVEEVEETKAIKKTNDKLNFPIVHQNQNKKIIQEKPTTNEPKYIQSPRSPLKDVDLNELSKNGLPNSPWLPVLGATLPIPISTITTTTTQKPKNFNPWSKNANTWANHRSGAVVSNNWPQVSAAANTPNRLFTPWPYIKHTTPKNVDEEEVKFSQNYVEATPTTINSGKHLELTTEQKQIKKNFENTPHTKEAEEVTSRPNWPVYGTSYDQSTEPTITSKRGGIPVYELANTEENADNDEDEEQKQIPADSEIVNKVVKDSIAIQTNIVPLSLNRNK